MEDLFREILAPLSPTSPTPTSALLPLPEPSLSSAQKTETQTGEDTGAPPHIGVGAGEAVRVESGMEVEMEMVDFGTGIDINMGGEQWTASEMEMQKILESLSEGYEAYQQQQVSDLDLGWDTFTSPTVGIF